MSSHGFPWEKVAYPLKHIISHIVCAFAGFSLCILFAYTQSSALEWGDEIF